MRFAYTRLPNTPPRPYLEIVLRNKFYTTPILTGLVDSGADRPIFDLETAELLKLDLRNAPTWPFSGTTGKPQKAKLAEVSISILRQNGTDHVFEITAKCAFCDDFKFAGGFLLGQDGFFSHFKTTFYQQQFEIELYPKK